MNIVIILKYHLLKQLLSELDLLVDSYIELFLDELVDSYLNEDSFNQYVLASLLHFDKYGYYNLDFNDYSYKEQSLSNISETYSSR